MCREDIRESKEARKKMLVIGADTVVVLDGKILGKPKDEADAFQMLSALQGRAHSGVHRSGDAGL
mgnify:CR=1 FL=1